MKFALNDKAKGVLMIAKGQIFNLIFFQKLDLSVFVDLEKFQP